MGHRAVITVLQPLRGTKTAFLASWGYQVPMVQRLLFATLTLQGNYWFNQLNMSNARRDENYVPTLLGVSSADGETPTLAYVNPITHRLLVQSGATGGAGTWWKVNGVYNGSNPTITIGIEASSDFLLVLARQPQAQTVGADTWDYSYTTGGGITTITYVIPPDASLNGQPHLAYLVS